MNLIYGISQVMHRIRVKLYPNYLPSGDQYLARTDSEATLTLEQVCASLRDRGGFTGNFNDLVEFVKQYNDEVAYQLCDGFTVNNGYYSIYPNLGGTFKTAHDTPDPKHHPLTFRFRPHTKLRKLAETIAVLIEGIADTGGYIDEYLDVESGAANSIFIPGHQFVISGHKIKIAGDDPRVGLYFTAAENPGDMVKVEHFAENSQSKIIGVTPALVFSPVRLEIRSQFSGSGSTFLKEPRVITSKFILEET